MSHGIQVRQEELKEIYELEQEIAQRGKRLEELKSDVTALLAAKMPIEEGRFDARLVFRRFHHVPWKQAVVDNLGVEFAEQFRKASPSTVHCDLMVEEHAIPPLWKGVSGNAETGG